MDITLRGSLHTLYDMQYYIIHDSNNDIILECSDTVSWLMFSKFYLSRNLRKTKIMFLER